MKRILCSLLIAAAVLVFIAAPVLAGDYSRGSSPYPRSDEEEYIDQSPPGEFILIDVLVVRPVGLVANIVGLAGAIVSAPLAAMTNSTDRVQKELLERPYRYTFCRPVGDLDY